MLKAVSLSVLGAIVLALLSGCGSSSRDALAFNQALANANKKLAAVGERFGKSVGEAVEAPNPANIEKLKQSHEDAKKTINDVKSELKGVKIPSSKSAQDLHEAHQRFLEGQEKTIDKDFAKMIQIVEDPKLAVPAKKGQIQDILTRIEQTEKQQLAPVQEKQRIFAKEHNIKLQ